MELKHKAKDKVITNLYCDISVLTSARHCIPLPTRDKLVASFPSNGVAAPVFRTSGIENEDYCARFGNQHRALLARVYFWWGSCPWSVINLQNIQVIKIHNKLFFHKNSKKLYQYVRMSSIRMHIASFAYNV